ncbi:MAG: hypothetical protein IAE95_07085 [Chitinophagaceae bacterium]|nr:hypothetical protein [Chitinophagaceae bacterium]
MNFALTLRCTLAAVLPLLCSIVVSGQPLLPGMSCKCDGGKVDVAWQCQFDGVKQIAINRSFDSLGRFDKVGRLDEPVKGVQHYFDTDRRTGNRYYKLVIEFNSGLVWQSNVCKMVVDTECVSTTKVSNEIMVKDTAGPVANNQLSLLSLKRIVLPRPIDNITEPLFVTPIHVGVQKNTGHVFVKLSTGISREKHSIDFYNKDGFKVVSIAEIAADYVLIEKRNFQHKGVYKFVLKRAGSELETGYITVLSDSK